MRFLPSVAVAVFVPFLFASPASALTYKQKLETCTFGANDQKLTGAKRKSFIARCMANRNDPRGPAPKPAAMKPATPPAGSMAAPAGSGQK